MADAEGDQAEKDQWMAGHKERRWWVSVWEEVKAQQLGAGESPPVI